MTKGQSPWRDPQVGRRTTIGDKNGKFILIIAPGLHMVPFMDSRVRVQGSNSRKCTLCCMAVQSTML